MYFQFVCVFVHTRNGVGWDVRWRITSNRKSLNIFSAEESLYKINLKLKDFS